MTNLSNILLSQLLFDFNDLTGVYREITGFFKMQKNYQNTFPL